ncbi:MAG: SusC/RagA family TonB-linked outer membrane protein [Prevotella sp.]|nr:SusC/RagA family TonB-linked outer membrane protein [Prevotella sp.]
MKRLSLILLFAMSHFMLCLAQQTYDVDYNNQSLEQVIKDLRKQTGYQFVYKKETLKDTPLITCRYRKATLQQLLNRIFYEEAGLDFEISKGTVILRKANSERPYFKRIVMGIVTDLNDDPLPGATVKVQNTSNGVTTDLEGIFSLTVEGKEPVLEISYVGMKPLTQKITSRTEKQLYIRMEADTKLLEEVLVTGYQNIKRENATGSYQLISSKTLDQRYTGDVAKNLEGLVPGLVSYDSGEGKGLTIRGIGSFEANTTPLVVVDGLPVEGGLESVNPYNIENITVLKDAAAASIYGARASNGVIVVTTKRAKSDKLEVNFNADLTIAEKPDYGYLQLANAEQLIELERYNYQYVKKNPSKSAYKSLQNDYKNNRGALSPIVRILMAKDNGEITEDEMESQLGRLAQNDYFDEWQDLWQRPQITHQYNLSLRNRGKYVNSSIVLNYKGDNMGISHEHDNTLTASYRGDMQMTKWLNLEFGANVISQRTKQHISSTYNDIFAFAPYQSMYNDDGTPAGMEADAWLQLPSLTDNKYGLKTEVYSPIDEIRRNFSRMRTTNIRSYVHANAQLMEGLTLSGMFQYEDIYSKTDSHYEADSYDMRHLYNLYTSTTGEHYLPDGGMLRTATSEGAYYTFRAQTDFSRTFAGKHAVDALLGFEFREQHYKTAGTLLMGYDEQSQTNNMGTANFGQLKNLEGTTSALGTYYQMFGAPTGTDFTTTDILHRFYSIYFTGGYTYDSRYAATVSYRVDKTDLFGADPEFRGRPLWSVGASWNIQNEQFMRTVSWVDALKLRASYGLTGNIAQNFSSFLTATVDVNEINGSRYATLNTPPNDQLRWEKTASLNIGIDFAVLKGRLTGAFDYYLKRGTDLLTTTDLDPTTGWRNLTINNGELRNTGIELQLNGEILQARNRRQVGISAAFSIAYNQNKVTAVNHEPTTGMEALAYSTFHQGYPVHSLFSYRFAGMEEKKSIQYFGWYDHNDEAHYTSLDSEEFTPQDIVYSGSLDPKVSMSFTPSVTWQGFTLSAMFAYYGGHVMRARVEDWTYDGSANGYRILAQLEHLPAVPASYLNYWTQEDYLNYPANGYAGSANVVGSYQYLDANVVPADYLKLRNVVLAYDFPKSLCHRLHMQSLRLRFQLNNLWTWTRNSLNIDPEANNPFTGESSLRVPRSYTMSLSVNF